MSKKLLALVVLAASPTVTDNIAAGYEVGQQWLNTVSGDTYQMVSDGVWKSTSPSLTPQVSYIDFNNALADPAYLEGRVFWNQQDHALAFHTDVPGTSIQIGQEQVTRIVNKTGSTILNGQVVYINGAQGNRPTVALAQANLAIADKTLGVATNDIANNAEGYITVNGLVRDINTSTFTAGDRLWLSPSVSGGFTNVEPSEPNHKLCIGTVLNATTNGMICVKIQHNTTRTELGLATTDSPTFAAMTLTGDLTFSGGSLSTALSGKQPLDSDLTAIAALTTTAYGRSFLTLADETAARNYVGLATTDSPTFAGVTTTGNIRAGLIELGSGGEIRLPGYDGDTDIAINYTGYNGGTTRFRSVKFYDGKQSLIATIDGATKAATFVGAIYSSSDITTSGYLRTGAAGSGTNGNVRIITDNGSEKWLIGTLGVVGYRNFSIYDLGNSAERLSIDGVTGVATFGGNVVTGRYCDAKHTTNDDMRGFRIYGQTDGATEFASSLANFTSGEFRHTAGYSTYGGYHTFFTNGVQRALIDSNGVVALETATAPGTPGSNQVLIGGGQIKTAGAATFSGAVSTTGANLVTAANQAVFDFLAGARIQSYGADAGTYGTISLVQRTSTGTSRIPLAINADGTLTFGGLINPSSDTGLDNFGYPGAIGRNGATTTHYTGDGTGYTWRIGYRSGGTTTMLLSIEDSLRYWVFAGSAPGTPASNQVLIGGGAIKTAGAITAYDTIFATDGTVQTIMSFGVSYGTIGTNSNHPLNLLVNGTTVAQFDSSTTAGHTRFLVYDVDNGTLERVTVGAADSGGTGYKVLRIPN